MAESAGNQLLSALTEGHEKGNKATTKKGSKAPAKIASGKGENQSNNRKHRGFVSGGQTVTSSSSSNRKFVLLRRVE